MVIKSLKNIPIAQIVACHKEAFSDYYIKVEDDAATLESNWKSEGIRYDLSFGAFEDDKLIGLILTGLEQEKGMLSAFNMGIGVIKSYRGRRVIDAIYAKAIPKLTEMGANRCYVEVLAFNERAIRAYQRIGFNITKYYILLNGVYGLPKGDMEIKKTTQKEIIQLSKDNILPKATDFYKVLFEESAIGFFTVDALKGTLGHFEVLDEAAPHHFKLLFLAIHQVSKNIPIHNISLPKQDIKAGLEMEICL